MAETRPSMPGGGNSGNGLQQHAILISRPVQPRQGDEVAILLPSTATAAAFAAAPSRCAHFFTVQGTVSLS
jgi:hypothetical protein